MKNQFLDKIQKLDNAIDTCTIRFDEKKILQDITLFVCMEHIRNVRDLALLLIESRYCLDVLSKNAEYFVALTDIERRGLDAEALRKMKEAQK